MSSKHDCGNHHWHERHHFFRRLFCFLFTLVLVVLVVVLIVYLVLRPTKPRFSLQDASVLTFNVTSTPSLLTSTLQVTIASRNPNDRIGIYYDSLHVYATYKAQQITVPVQLQPLYQGHNDVSVWSPYLSGSDVPIAPYLSLSLGQDQNAGVMLLNVKADGRVKWKVGSWISGTYHLFVNCPAYFTFDSNKASGDGFVNGVFSPTVRFQQISACNVDV